MAGIPNPKLNMTHDELHAFVAGYPTRTAAAVALGVAPSTLISRLNAAVSTLRKYESAEGDVVLEWTKQPGVKGGDNHAAMLEAIDAAMKNYTPISPIPVFGKKDMDPDLLTVYVIADHHLMMLAWEPETGNSYDLKIAETVLRDTLTRVVEAAPASKHAVILNLGDFFHADDNSARTARSGHELATDGRYDKALELGVQLHVWAVELALQKHETVEVAILPGNHDQYAAKALNLAMRWALKSNPRAKLTSNPSVFWHKQWGKTMLAAHHGHLVKPAMMPGVMASTWPKIWGETTHRYAMLGHIHHGSKGGDEQAGAVWETFQTLAAKDEYAYGNGYRSGRSMTAIVYHKDGGEDARITKQVRV